MDGFCWDRHDLCLCGVAGQHPRPDPSDYHNNALFYAWQDFRVSLGRDWPAANLFRNCLRSFLVRHRAVFTVPG